MALRRRREGGRPTQLSTMVRRGETHGTTAPQLSRIRWKPLIALGFRAHPKTSTILDSPTPRQYGPRGFEDGWIHLASLVSSRCRQPWPSKMAERDRNEGKDSDRSAEEAALSARLQHLGERLGQTAKSRKDEAGQLHTSQNASAQNASALARGFRLSTELVAGVLVGAFIGWALDWWLGISPWGMIVFLLLGFAAGVVNVIRAAGVSSGPGSGR